MLTDFDHTLTFNKEIKDGKISISLLNSDDYRSNSWGYRISSIGKKNNIYLYKYLVFLNIHINIYIFFF